MSDSVFDRLGWSDPDRRDDALFRLAKSINEANEPDEPSVISPAERRSIEAISHGVGVVGAAEMLGLSDHTIRSQIKTASAKLRAKNGVHLVAIALRKGLIA